MQKKQADLLPLHASPVSSIPSISRGQKSLAQRSRHLHPLPRQNQQAHLFHQSQRVHRCFLEPVFRQQKQKEKNMYM